VNNWINMLFYQATWLAAVIGAGHGLWWPGVAIFAAFAACQLATSAWRRADVCLIVVIGIAGFVIDSIFAQCGLMEFATWLPWKGMSPVWMVMLWTSFALALNHSLAFLQQRTWLATALGGIGAPLAYWAAGSGWHALTFGARPMVTLALVAIVWAALMPLLARLALRLRVLDAGVAPRLMMAAKS
jgi:hypothetical protein